MISIHELVALWFYGMFYDKFLCPSYLKFTEPLALGSGHSGSAHFCPQLFLSQKFYLQSVILVCKLLHSSVFLPYDYEKGLWEIERPVKKPVLGEL